MNGIDCSFFIAARVLFCALQTTRLRLIWMMRTLLHMFSLGGLFLPIFVLRKKKPHSFECGFCKWICDYLRRLLMANARIATPNIAAKCEASGTVAARINPLLPPCPLVAMRLHTSPLMFSTYVWMLPEVD